jgi:hypothetical protein
MLCKKIDALTAEDLSEHPVWEFALDKEEEDETLVRPVKELPVRSLTNRVVGTMVHLANGAAVWAIMGNMDLENPARTREFLGLSLLWKGRWNPFNPPHDFGDAGSEAVALAHALGLRINDVFPISYDVSKNCVGGPNIVRGTIASGFEKI